MNLPWFRRVGIFYVPAKLIGWIIFFSAIAYVVYVFIEINGNSHSVSDALINFVFSLLIIGAVYSLIGFLTSRTSNS